jgi:oligopeptide transport system ATP-binding protein
MSTNGDGSGDLVQIIDLQMYFPVTKGIILQRQVGAIKAVDGVLGVERAARA